MSEYAVEKREYEPKNIFAGDFPTLTETGTAGAKLAAYTPVTINSDGDVVAVVPASGSGSTAVTSTIDDVVGITAAATDNDTPVVYFMTGEFFADAINLPTGVTIDALKPALRKKSIFLR